MKKNRLAAFASSILAASALSTTACGLTDEGDDSFSRVLRYLLVPSPGAVNDTQAVCADGTDARDRAQEVVDDLNADLGDDKALLEALATAEGRAEGPITTYEVEVDGRTMVVEAVSDGENSTYTGTIDGEQVLSGATTGGEVQGALTFGDLQVAWDETDGVIRAARTTLTGSAALFFDDESVRIAAQSGADSISAGWTATEGVFVSGDEVLCWEGDEQCNVDCNPDLVDSLSASLD